jgi:ribokinase
MPSITVIGSLNMDIVVRAPRFPGVGETIAGLSCNFIPGGKGANQALAAARAGTTTLLVGCVGNDEFGSQLVKGLSRFGVDVSNVIALEGVTTGTATVVIEKNGDNRIIIVSGANALVSPALIDEFWPEISKSGMILLQHEIPLETVFHIIEKAEKSGIKVILNPAPFYPIEFEILRKVDTLIANETEGTALSGVEIKDVESATEAAGILHEKGIDTVLITLGKSGSVLVNHEQSIFQPAYQVNAVDTTAAGDTFIGAYAAAIIGGESTKKALLYATAAAGLAVTKLGAQPSIPDHNEIIDFLAKMNHETAYSYQGK